MLAELREGARLVWHHPLLRAIAMTSVAWNIAWFVLQAVYVPLAIGRLGLDSAAVGLTLASLWWRSGALAGLSFFLFGAGPILWTITSTTLRRMVTPQAMLGRVSAIFLTFNMGARPLGAALGGAIGASWGEGSALLVSTLFFGVQLLLIVASPMRTLKGLPQQVA